MKLRHQVMKVGLVQMDSVLGDLEANVQHVVKLADAHRGKVDLLVFPELALTGYAIGARFHEFALRPGDEKLSELLEASHGITLAVGFIEETDAFHFYNSLAFIRDGKLVHVHRKIYLPNYGIFEERKYFKAGTKVDTFELGRFRIGPFVCGDAWNPGLVHMSAADHAHILIFSVCSPEKGLGNRLSSEDNWKRMNRFYATVYGCYVIFVNRIGSENTLSFWGQSELIDPFGCQVAGFEGKEEGVLVCELNLAEVREARTTLYTARDDDLDLMERRLKHVKRNRHR